jgi:ABC-2 type transport system permease protein
MFLVSFSRITVWRLADLVIAIVLIAVGVNMAGEITTPLNILMFTLLTISGSLVIYSLWIVLIAFTFWFTKFDNNVTILQALTDTGRYPVTVYPWWLRVIVTYIVPIGLATTVPVQALRGELTGWNVLVFLGVSAIAFFIASRVWKVGVKRYSGASS